MKAEDIALMVNEARDKFYMMNGRVPESLAIYVSLNQYDELLNDVFAAGFHNFYYMDSRNPFEFMGYPLYRVCNDKNNHPEVRITFEV